MNPQEMQAGVQEQCRRRRRRLLVCTGVIIGLFAAGTAVKYGRYHVIPKRFAVVEPGRLYRSGALEPGPLHRIVEKHGIRTILTLLRDEPDDRRQQAEKDLVARRGIELVRIPMPGDGRGRFDDLDRAADLLADETRYPVLVHCAAGVQRTGAVYVAYRLRHCGWSLEQALAENRRLGYPIDDQPELIEHLTSYAARSPATRPAGGAPSPVSGPQADAAACGAVTR